MVKSLGSNAVRYLCLTKGTINKIRETAANIDQAIGRLTQPMIAPYDPTKSLIKRLMSARQPMNHLSLGFSVISMWRPISVRPNIEALQDTPVGSLLVIHQGTLNGKSIWFQPLADHHVEVEITRRAIIMQTWFADISKCGLSRAELVIVYLQQLLTKHSL